MWVLALQHNAPWNSYLGAESHEFTSEDRLYSFIDFWKEHISSYMIITPAGE